MALSEKNVHPRDKRISFQEEGHIYTIEGLDEHPISVTTLIHKYFPEFEADKVIDKMMRSAKWAHSKYYGMTKEEIKKKWEDEKNTAAELGTKMHKAIEEYINGQLKETPQTKEFEYFLRFWEDLKALNPDLKPYRTEWLVYDERKKVAGSIDLVLINSKEELIIVDWKRSKEIKTNNPYQSGLYMFSHLDDCNYVHYSIQLNIYRHLLETNYDKKVIGMCLLIFHPNNERYNLYYVNRMQKEIDDLWNTL